MIAETREQLHAEAEQTQKMILDRQTKVEDTCATNDNIVQDYTQVVMDIKELFDRDYQEFVRDRKRWKSDFASASNKATSNFQQIQGLLNQCIEQEQVNTQALKLVVDAQMIEQLCEQQDIVDKKQIGLFGMRTQKQVTNKELLNDSPCGKHPKTQNHDFNAGRSIMEGDPMITEEDARNVIQVDRNCLSCSGNNNQIIHQLKLACLSYTHSPIVYQEKKY